MTTDPMVATDSGEAHLAAVIRAEAVYIIGVQPLI